MDRQSDPIDADLMQRSGSNDLTDFEVIFRRIGIGSGTGRYNYLVLAAMIFCNVFPGMISLSANFTAANMPFNCTEYEHTGQSMIGCTVVSEAAPNFQCRIHYNCSTFMSTVEDNGQKLDFMSWTTGCRGFSFHSGFFQETSVSRFGLACERAWMATLATTFYFVGFIVGCSLYGVLADRFGRLKMTAASLVHIFMCTVGASQAPSLWLYWSLQLLTGAGAGGLMSCTYSFALEHADPKQRLTWGFNLHNGWTGGIFLGTLIAYFERHYQRLLLYYGLATLAVLPILALLSESPRWLVASRRYKQADAVLNRIARINGRPLCQGFSTEEVAARNQSSDTEDTSALDLLRRSGMRRVTCIVWAMFFSVSLAYYGISLGIGDLGGSIFLNQLIAGAVEIPARILGILASYRIGRRLSIMLAFGLAGSCLLVSAFMFGDSRLITVQIATALTGKFWITMAFDLAWLYAAEVFPTVVRSLGVGSGSTFASAGAMVSTLVPGLGFIWRPLPHLVFALGPMCVVLLAFAVPETKGHRLPESLDDGERLAHWKRSKSYKSNYIDNKTEM